MASYKDQLEVIRSSFYVSGTLRQEWLEVLLNIASSLAEESDHYRSVFKDLAISYADNDNEIIKELELISNCHGILIHKPTLLVFESVVLKNGDDWTMICIGQLDSFDSVSVRKHDQESLRKLWDVVNKQLKEISLEIRHLGDYAKYLRPFDVKRYEKWGLL